jgi:hypothetical protein
VVLSETDSPPLWDWPEDTTLEAVYAETDHPTDDVLVTNSAGGRAFIQAKSRVTLSVSPTSDLRLRPPSSRSSI